jgi:hypothetical protein
VKERRAEKANRNIPSHHIHIIVTIHAGEKMGASGLLA